jgi:hypothetical protein
MVVILLMIRAFQRQMDKKVAGRPQVSKLYGFYLKNNL